MEIKKKATAGSLESSDVQVLVEPNESGIELEIESVVFNQFGQEIEKVVRELLDDFNVSNIKIHINDKGAVDYVIKARLETALRRAEGVI